jgi:Fe-S-cluster containining protein
LGDLAELWTVPSTKRVSFAWFIRKMMGRQDCGECPEPGACCRYYRKLNVGVLLTDEEAPRYPEAIPSVLGYFLPLKPGTGECIFLDEQGRCKVHKTRKPEVCRVWHCFQDFDEGGRPSWFLEDHPHILRWVRTKQAASQSEAPEGLIRSTTAPRGKRADDRKETLHGPRNQRPGGTGFRRE